MESLAERPYDPLFAATFDWIDRRLPRPSFRRRFGIVVLPGDLSLSGLATQGTHGFGLFLATLIVIAAIGAGFGEEGDNRALYRMLPAYVLLAVPLASVLCGAPLGSSIGCQTCANARL